MPDYIEEIDRKSRIPMTGKESWILRTDDKMTKVHIDLDDTVVIESYVKGLNLHPATPRFMEYAEHLLSCRNCLFQIPTDNMNTNKLGRSMFVDMSKNDLVKMEKLQKTYISPDNTPYFDCKITKAFYNMEKRSMAYICRFTFLIDTLQNTKSTWVCEMYKQMQAIIAETPYTFKAVDADGNVLRRFSVHNRPYKGVSRDMSKGWHFNYYHKYVIGTHL